MQTRERLANCRGPLITVCLLEVCIPAASVTKPKPGCLCCSQHRGWRRLRSAWGKGSLELNEPFVAVSQALPLFSASQRWHWRQPGPQEHPHTCLTCRPSQSPLQRFSAISDPLVYKGFVLGADPLITVPGFGSIFSCFCRIYTGPGWTQPLQVSFGDQRRPGGVSTPGHSLETAVVCVVWSGWGWVSSLFPWVLNCLTGEILCKSLLVSVEFM